MMKLLELNHRVALMPCNRSANVSPQRKTRICQMKKLILATLIAGFSTGTLAGIPAALNTDAVKVPEVSLDTLVANYSEHPAKETDWYMTRQQEGYAVNTYKHNRLPSNKDNQFVIRENEDTLYSHAILDVSKSATISMPKYDEYAIVQVIDENHYTIAVVYPGESKTLTHAMLSSGNHVFLNTRVGAENYSGADLKKANAYQDAIKLSSATANPYKPKGYDEKVVFAERKALSTLRKQVPEPFKMFGNKNEVDERSYIIASAAGWAGLPAKDASYVPLVIGNEGDTTCSSLTVNKPPLQYDRHAFFSMTVYNKDGWIVDDNYALSSKHMKPNADGTYTFRFNCEGADNNLRVQKDWNPIFRMYLPTSSAEIIDYVKNDYLKKARLVAGDGSN
jgi:hypothetical protein